MKQSHLTVKMSLMMIAVGSNNNVAENQETLGRHHGLICGILMVAILSLELPVDCRHEAVI